MDQFIVRKLPNLSSSHEQKLKLKLKVSLPLYTYLSIIQLVSGSEIYLDIDSFQGAHFKVSQNYVVF